MVRARLTLDTSLEAEQLQVELWRVMSSVEKAQAITAACRAARDMAFVGIRQRHPGVSERECLLRFAILTLGAELAREAYPDAAELIE